MSFGALGLVGGRGRGGAPWALASDVYTDLDFLNNRGFSGASSIGTADSFLTTSRASTKYAPNSAGIYIPFGNNILAVTDLGALSEESRTNVALWCRDLTNAAWVKTSITAALNQTGVDGAANSASSITASGANGTCLQAITLGSSARFQSAFVKRITGSGVVNMTMDNGVTWTAVTVTAAWTRVTIPTQTLANPTVGFRIVTSGDAIAVDFAQNENNGEFASSPILTTTVAVTRAADAVTVTSLPTFGVAYTIFGKGTPNAPVTSAIRQELFVYSDTSNNNYVGVERAATNGIAVGRYKSAGTNFDITSSVVWAQGSSGKLIATYAAGDQAISFNGAAVVTGSSALVPANTTLGVGSNNNGGSFWNGYVERIALWRSTRLTNAQLQALTT